MAVQRYESTAGDFFTHLTVQGMGPIHPWSLVIESWFLFYKLESSPWIWTRDLWLRSPSLYQLYHGLGVWICVSAINDTSEKLRTKLIRINRNAYYMFNYVNTVKSFRTLIKMNLPYESVEKYMWTKLMLPKLENKTQNGTILYIVLLIIDCSTYLYNIYIYIYTPALPLSGTDGRYI